MADRVDSFLHHLVLGESGFIGVENHFAMIPIDDDHLASRDIREAVPESDDGGDFECTGEDRGVAGVASDLGRKPQYELAIEAGGFAGCEVVSEDDDRSGEVHESAQDDKKKAARRRPDLFRASA